MIFCRFLSQTAEELNFLNRNKSVSFGMRPRRMVLPGVEYSVISSENAKTRGIAGNIKLPFEDEDLK